MSGNANGFIPEELIDRRVPVHYIEPEIPRFDEVRDARLQCVRILNAFASALEKPITSPKATVRDVAIAYWSCCYALGLNICNDTTMTARAEILGVERAAISKRARNFVSANGLQPSWHMKAETAIDHYTSTRIAEVERSNGHAATG